MTDDDETEYALVMPFVVVKSQGGPYDDDAFTAGWQASQIDRVLSAAVEIGASALAPISVPPALLPQLDLIAMKHGYQATSEPWAEAPEHWALVTFSKPAVQ